MEVEVEAAVKVAVEALGHRGIVAFTAATISAGSAQQALHPSISAHGLAVSSPASSAAACQGPQRSSPMHPRTPCIAPSQPEASRHQIVAPTRFLVCRPLVTFSPGPSRARALSLRPLHSLLCLSAALHLIPSCLFGLLITTLITETSERAPVPSLLPVRTSPQVSRPTNQPHHRLCLQRAYLLLPSANTSASRACLPRQSPFRPQLDALDPARL